MSEGVRREDVLKEARKYFKLASIQNHSIAQGAYAHMLFHGEGGGEKSKEARSYYKLAVDRGNDFSQYHYAIMLRDGLGGEKNLKNALKYFKLAA